MRRFVAVLAAALVALAPRAAGAAGLCDPHGHFCIQLDTASARVCDPLKSDVHNDPACRGTDAQLRSIVRRLGVLSHGTGRPADAMKVMFDDWTVVVVLLRGDAAPELTQEAAQREAATIVESIGRDRDGGGLPIEEVQPVALIRLHDVQAARLECRLAATHAEDAMMMRNIFYDVRARDAQYSVVFIARDRDAARLAALVERSMGTLDALPVKEATGGAADGLVWLLRAVVAAAVLAVGAVLWRRRKGAKRGIEPKDLWPG
jgi:hypothetical protein